MSTAPGARWGRAARLAGWAPLCCLVVLVLLAPGLPAWLRYGPLVASALLLGMPHGAADVVALPRARSGRVTAGGLALVGILYLALGSGYALLWLLAPVPAAVLFLGLTVAHWGQGDVYALRRLYGAAHLERPGQQALTAAVRGGVPMVVPLLAFPERSRAVLDSFVGPFGGAVGAWWVFSPAGRAVLGVSLAALTLVTLVRGRALAGRGDARAWRLDAAETGLLWLVFLAVPPVLAVGAYFVCWHSLRHVLRVLRLHGPSAAAVDRGEWAAPVGRFAVETALPTLGGFAVLAGLWLLAPGGPTGISGLVGLALAGVAVLTLPHLVVVTLLDRRDGLWRVGATGRGSGPAEGDEAGSGPARSR